MAGMTDAPSGSSLPDGVSVEEWNDQLAREHDIDAYYAGANPVLRAIEKRRLSLIRSLIAPRPGERLLEVGCGGGHVLALFPECELVGTDVSGAMLDKARRRLAGRPVELLKGELDELGLPAASFDAVVCTEVLEHVVDPDAVLASIASLLAPTGRAVVTFPNDSLINSAKRFARKTRLASLPGFRRIDWGGDEFHLHAWPISEMRTLLDRHFRIESEAYSPTRLAPVSCCFLVRPRGASAAGHAST